MPACFFERRSKKQRHSAKAVMNVKFTAAFFVWKRAESGEGAPCNEKSNFCMMPV